MGYEVEVNGKLKVNDARAFYKAVKAHDETKEFFEYADFDGKEGQDGIYDLDDGDKFEIYYSGGLWFEDEDIVKTMAKHATGEIKFVDEDHDAWKYKLNGDGTYKRFRAKQKWAEEAA